MTDDLQPLGFTKHDHQRCIASTLEQAEALCSARKVQLTPVRRRTLEILLEHHAALGAYEVLERLAKDGFGSKPPVAYRALGFLVDNGLAHRVERLNAYVACVHPGDSHDPAFLICRGCGQVAEAEARSPLGGTAGFAVESTVVEAEGLCPACQETGA
ncbi:Fur family transcriptional regulator [Oceanicola sp. 22II-s10i]|uniref:Fur family transcriptional regulator n=1 Tax=Oceanicola sp. 22II-s10i TaxID=1317116 RepID=UPI000B525EA5|nr:Fur family transcriptional regulator [Oceanicola sp. 22II-s10i]OWU86204.1 Fur family transcriptional regulator [Oceanicola sp. 22II-s10i]